MDFWKGKTHQVISYCEGRQQLGCSSGLHTPRSTTAKSDSSLSPCLRGKRKEQRSLRKKISMPNHLTHSITQAEFITYLTCEDCGGFLENKSRCCGASLTTKFLPLPQIEEKVHIHLYCCSTVITFYGQPPPLFRGLQCNKWKNEV